MEHRFSIKANLIAATCLMALPLAIQADETEIFTFWSTPGEQKALNTYIEAMSAQGHKMNVITSPTYDDMREQIAERITLDIPPNFSHWLWGNDLLTLSQDANLVPLSSEINGRAVEDIIYPEILPEITNDEGEILAIPVGTHLQAIVLSNSDALNDIGYSALPKTWPELFELADKLEAEGQKAFALTDAFWVLGDTFAGILVGIGQKEAALDLYGEFDKSGNLHDNLASAMEIFLELRSYSGEDDIGSSWSDVVDRVTTGDAAIGFMGDFARSQILSHGEEAAENVICSPFPGKSAAFFGVDVFIGFERAPQSAENFKILQEVILDPENNSRYVSYKGGLPVVINASLDELDQCSRNSLAIWQDNPDQRVTMTARDSSAVSKVHRILGKIWEDHSLSASEAADLMYKYVSGEITETDLETQ